MLRVQYSAAQNTVPVSKEGVLTPDEEPEVQGEEPRADKDDQPEVQDEDELTNKHDDSESGDQPEPIDLGRRPRRFGYSRLDTTDATHIQNKNNYLLIRITSPTINVAAVSINDSCPLLYVCSHFLFYYPQVLMVSYYLLRSFWHFETNTVWLAFNHQMACP
jgi:hypothetical protein